jgi:hypothetical protein
MAQRVNAEPFAGEAKMITPAETIVDADERGAEALYPARAAECALVGHDLIPWASPVYRLLCARCGRTLP